MTSCARDVWIQMRSLASWHLRRRGLGWVLPDTVRPYKDYNGWFRTNLRPWVEGLLLDRRALDRGYFQPAFVRQLLAEHDAGANHAVRIGALLTIELWHRQFAD
jgi:asparagine synthase (glutamine-hydrolysing)